MICYPALDILLNFKIVVNYKIIDLKIMSSLGSQSQSRKERLAQLRSLKRKNENSDKDDVRIQQEAKSER